MNPELRTILLEYDVLSLFRTSQKQSRLHKVHENKEGILGGRELVPSVEGGRQLPGSAHTEAALARRRFPFSLE